MKAFSKTLRNYLTANVKPGSTNQPSYPRPGHCSPGTLGDADFTKAKEMGFDGLELACWGDHFEVDQALADDNYVNTRWQLLQDHGLECYSISNHLVGQAVCDLIDERHQAILSPEIWGDGDPEGVRQRAAEEMKQTARAAAT